MRTLSITGVAVLLVLASATTWAKDDPKKEEPKKEPGAELQVEVKLAKEVQERQPVDPGTRFESGKLYCWNLLQGGQGDFVVHHVWKREGKQVWKRAVRGRGAKWVTWSYHNVTPGKWSVEVIDEAGKLLASSEFVVQ